MMSKREMKNLFKRKPRRTLSEVSAEFAKKIPPPPKNARERKREMKEMSELKLTYDAIKDVNIDKLSKKELRRHCIRLTVLIQKFLLEEIKSYDE